MIDEAKLNAEIARMEPDLVELNKFIDSILEEFYESCGKVGEE